MYKCISPTAPHVWRWCERSLDVKNMWRCHLLFLLFFFWSFNHAFGVVHFENLVCFNEIVKRSVFVFIALFYLLLNIFVLVVASAIAMCSLKGNDVLQFFVVVVIFFIVFSLSDATLLCVARGRTSNKQLFAENYTNNWSKVSLIVYYLTAATLFLYL